MSSVPKTETKKRDVPARFTAALSMEWIQDERDNLRRGHLCQMDRGMMFNAIEVHGMVSGMDHGVTKETWEDELIDVLDTLVFLPDPIKETKPTKDTIGVYFCKFGVVYSRRSCQLGKTHELFYEGDRFDLESRRCFIVRDGYRIAVKDTDFFRIRFDEAKGVYVCGDVEFSSGRVLIDFEFFKKRSLNW